jgi:hypothetical protein
MAYALLLTALNVAFTAMAFQVPASDWQGKEVYARTYRGIAFVPQAIGLLTIPALILMLSGIHLCADERHGVWSLAGLCFGTAHAGLLGVLYFIHIGVLLPALRRGDWQGLDQFAFANPGSVAWGHVPSAAWGLDDFAWALLGVALLLMAWVFEGDRLRRWIRWLFVLNGLANVSLTLAFALGIEPLTLGVAFLSWVLGLPISTVLVALAFRDRQRAS